jgi:MFS family permease
MATPSTAPNRWLIAVAGTIVMICLGTVYSWSSFTQPLIASFNWSNQTTTWAFAVAIFFVGWGAVVGGRWQDKAGPRIVMLIGVLLWGLGNLLAGLGTAQLGAPWLYLTYGVIGGFGNGMAYITPLATVTKWFPDKRGLASGMVVMGFGLGAFFYGFLLKAIAPFQVASKHAGAFADAKAAAVAAHTTFDPTAYALGGADISAIMGTFVATGIGIAIIGGIAAAIMRNPPDGYTVPGAIAAAASTQPSYTPTQVLRSPQFYLLWLMLFLNVTAGILIISNAVPIIRELTGAAAAVAVPAYGLVAIFNGLGRFFWGAVSDRIGRNYAFALIFGLQFLVFLVLAGLHSLPLVLGAFAIVLLCYGGGFGTMPSFNADYFGTKYLGINYGMIITAWGFAGLVGPLLAAKVKDATGSFSGALVPVAIMLLVATILPFITKKPSAAAVLSAMVKT